MQNIHDQMMKTSEKKKSKYSAKHKMEWEIAYPWSKESEKGLNLAFRKLCQRHFSVAHAGKNDVSKHGDTDILKELSISQLNFT